MVSWLYLTRKEPFKSPIVCSKSSTFDPTSEDRDIPKRNWTEAEFKVRNEKVKISDFKSRSRIFFSENSFGPIQTCSTQKKLNFLAGNGFSRNCRRNWKREFSIIAKVFHFAVLGRRQISGPTTISPNDTLTRQHLVVNAVQCWRHRKPCNQCMPGS